MDKNDPEAQNASVEDLINQGSVQHITNPYESALDKAQPSFEHKRTSQGGSSAANSYINDLLGRVEDAIPNSTVKQNPIMIVEPARTVSPQIRAQFEMEPNEAN